MGTKAKSNTTSSAAKFSVVVWKNMAVKNIALNDIKMMSTAAEIGKAYMNRFL